MDPLSWHDDKMIQGQAGWTLGLISSALSPPQRRRVVDNTRKIGFCKEEGATGLSLG